MYLCLQRWLQIAVTVTNVLGSCLFWTYSQTAYTGSPSGSSIEVSSGAQCKYLCLNSIGDCVIASLVFSHSRGLVCQLSNDIPNDHSKFIDNPDGQVYVRHDALTSLTADVDAADCQWYYSAAGEDAACGAGQVAVGACGSLANASCADGMWNAIKCCNTQSLVLLPTRSTQRSLFGVDTVCPADQLVMGLCGVAIFGDCGGDFTVLNCQETNLQISSSCTWQYGEAGENLTCAHYHVLQGKCGSGMNNDCYMYPNRYAHGIYCCSLL